MGRHRAPEPIDPDKPFEHPDLKGETTPSKIKANLDAITAEEGRQRDRVIRERGQSGS